MGMLNRLGAVAFVVLSVGNCPSLAGQVDPSLEEAIRERAAYVLNDPYSAVFTFDIHDQMDTGETGKICGTVNAKNAFGAYTGRQFFFAAYVHIGDAYEIIAFSVPGYSLEQAVAYGGICD